MPYKFIFALSISLLLIACKKNETFTIQAIDANTGTGEAYAGMTYHIEENQFSIGTVKYDVVSSGVFNEDGRALVDLSMKN